MNEKTILMNEAVLCVCVCVCVCVCLTVCLSVYLSVPQPHLAKLDKQQHVDGWNYKMSFISLCNLW